MKGKDRKLITTRTVGSKIILAALFDCVILIVSILFVLQGTMTRVEEDLNMDHLEADINYLEDLITRDGGYWHIEDRVLYYGDTVIGDGTVEGANVEPFLYIEKNTGTLCYTGMKIPDEEAAGKASHYLRIAGCTKDANGNPIMGTYLEKNVADVLDVQDSYTGFADVQGRNIFCLYKTLYNEDGDNVGYIVVGRAKADIYGHAVNAGRSITAVVVLVVLGAGIAIVAITRRWAKSVQEIDKYLGRISDGELPDDKLVLNVRDDIGDIAGSINNMVASLKEKERIGAELSVASDIQKNLLPRTFPPFPEHDEFDLFATMNPAREVGGDFYDFFELDSSHIALVMADVSGKGVPAALFMVTARTLIKDHVQLGLSPAETFTTVNNILCEGNDSGMFVTGWLGVFDADTGKLVYANAGHNPPLVKRENGSFDYLRTKHGFVLAGLEGVRYSQNEITLAPGDALFLYTDGVTEATDVNDRLYGEDRLKMYLDSNGDGEVRAVLAGLKQDIDTFAGSREQFDDITMMLLQYRSFGSAAAKTFAADVSVLPEVLAFAEEELDKSGCPMKTAMQITVALEELFANVASYAYPDGKGDVEVKIKPTDSSVYISLTDTGIPFDPLAKADPDVTLSADERGVGGLGIYMVKKMMDDVKYTYRNNHNTVTMIKKL